MAESDASTRSGSEGSAALFAAALGAASGAGNIEALIERQIAIADLQIEDMRREDKLRHWSLRVRHVSDVMKLTFELALALIVVAAVALIGITVWKAAHDNSLVIEAFSVPPELAARGLTGEAVAAQVQDHLAVIQDSAKTSRPADSYASNWGDDVKVQIPDTGLSVGQFYRLLVSWFGHETRISGEVYRTPHGIAMAVRTTGQPGDIVRGSDDDLDGVVQDAAEAIYARTQPYRYAMYLLAVNARRNHPRAEAILTGLAATGTPLDRAWSYMGISTYAELTDPLGAPAINRKAIPFAPDFALPYQNIGAEESTLGHDEAALPPWRKTVALLNTGDGGMTARARNITLPSSVAGVAEMTGDFETALRNYEIASALPDYAGMAELSNHRIAYELGALHETARARWKWAHRSMPAGPRDTVLADVDDAQVLAGFQDWAGVLALKAQIETLLISKPTVPFNAEYTRQTLARDIWPYAALALAHRGDMKSAAALIAKTPRDCLICIRVRGQLAAMRRDWAEAARWYAIASAQAPSIAFPDTDWGQMLMAKGDLNGAIAKFDSANQKGSHFADPLEMWGEALIAKNRSDLALAKFDEASKYAPKWGRLHLKWAEALLWTGDRSDAKKQFAIASGLDLTQSEKSELERMNKTHG